MDSTSYYNTIKDSYEKLYREEQIGKIRKILSLIDIKRSDKILDVGAGTGILEELLKDYDITAIEPSDLYYIMSKKRLNSKLIKADFLSFESEEKFDIVFAITVIQDINIENREKFIKKLFNLTKNGGKIVISVLNRSGIDLDYLRPINKICVENDIVYVFNKAN